MHSHCYVVITTVYAYCTSEILLLLNSDSPFSSSPAPGNHYPFYLHGLGCSKTHSRKAMTNPDSVEKQRHYSADKGPYSQGCGLRSGHARLWELDHREGNKPKNWCLKLWCWRRLLKVPWTARRSNQSLLKEINPEYSPEGLMLNLKLQCFPHLMQTQLFGKVPAAGKDWGQKEKEGVRGWGGWIASLMQWSWTWVNFGRWWVKGGLACCSPCGHRVGHDWATE